MNVWVVMSLINVWVSDLMNTIFVLALKVVFILPHVNCKTIVVALDGFRWDYVFRYKDDLPVLNKLLQKSTFLDKGIINAFPTLTFPNMRTYMTGVWPEDHGIISNSFYNRKLKRKFSMAELDYRFLENSYQKLRPIRREIKLVGPQFQYFMASKYTSFGPQIYYP